MSENLLVTNVFLVHIWFSNITTVSRLQIKTDFPGGSVVRNTPAKQETQVQSLDQEDPLEKEMATHSSVLAWETSWTGEPGGL